MPIILPHANKQLVSDIEFFAAWCIWFERFNNLSGYQNRNPLSDCIPRLNRKNSLDISLIQGRQFSLDVLCRILANPSYRNAMQATGPFMNINHGYIEPSNDTNPKNGKIVNSAKLTPHAQQLLSNFQTNIAVWEEAKAHIESRIGADIELINQTSHETELLDFHLEEVACDQPLQFAKDCPKGKITNMDDLARLLVEWINNDSFQSHYRGRPIGSPVIGWGPRLNKYFWPNPNFDLAATNNVLEPILSKAKQLAKNIPFNSGNKQVAKDWADNIFRWGGVPQNEYDSDTVESVINAAIDGCVVGNRPPMNSGWTKVAAFATEHLERDDKSLVIWDSRVAHSLIKRIDALLFNNGYTTIPNYLCDIGVVPGRGGSRSASNAYNFAWPNGYRRWETIFAGSKLVRKVRNELMSQKILGPKNMEGKPIDWTVRTVEMVLFMDGY